jgi:hypothetical protein
MGNCQKRVRSYGWLKLPFKEFYHACFWFMREDTEIREADLPYLIKRLRAEWGPRGFERAAEFRD